MMHAIRAGVLALCFLFTPIAAVSWIHSAEDRLDEQERIAESELSSAKVAAAADEQYCTVALKRILRRVLKSCGLIGRGGAGGRGCQPVDARSVATMSGDDFNALFLPMKDRGGIIQFEQGEAELDASAQALLDRVFADQRGASYFFIVARASPEGTVQRNREISEARANAIMTYLREKYADPDLEREVGLLWLGEEYAQLDESFCEWARSGDPNRCDPREINRSAFIAWIDCQL